MERSERGGRKRERTEAKKGERQEESPTLKSLRTHFLLEARTTLELSPPAPA